MFRFLLALIFSLWASLAFAQGCGQTNPNCIVPTAPFGTNNNQAASTAFVQASGGGSFLNNLPQFTFPCNPTGVTAPAIACAALIAQAPLLVSSGILSINNNISASQLFFGINAGNSTLTGVNNVGLGPFAASSLTTGAQNAVNGYAALQHGLSSSNIAALGFNAFNALTGGGASVGIGTSALTANLTGFQNTCAGYQCLKDSAAAASGNTAVGYTAGVGLTSGQFNLLLGAWNGTTVGITTGSNNTVLGPASGLAAGLANAIIIADGVGNQRLTWDNTASRWTAAGGVITPAITSNGTPPTGNTGTCSTGVTVAGGSTVGTWTSTAICALAGTIILTAMPTQPTGYVCRMSDRTTAGVVIEETATTVTSATFVVRSLPTGTVATVANDILQYDCRGY